MIILPYIDLGLTMPIQHIHQPQNKTDMLAATYIMEIDSFYLFDLLKIKLIILYDEFEQFLNIFQH
jgi:hypothetical protein